MRIALAALTLGFTLAGAGLVSCAGPEGPPVSPGPQPSGTPVFASDEEALAAAEAAYSKYEAAINEVGHGGWKDTDLYLATLAGDALRQELEGADELASRGYVQVGDTTHDTMTLQQAQDHGHGTVTLVVYVCSDVSDVDVLNQEGESVVSPERPSRQPLEVEMNDLSGALKIVRRDAWSGTSFC
jgi:hypothetical protein